MGRKKLSKCKKLSKVVSFRMSEEEGRILEIKKIDPKDVVRKELKKWLQ